MPRKRKIKVIKKEYISCLVKPKKKKRKKKKKENKRTCYMYHYHTHAWKTLPKKKKKIARACEMREGWGKFSN